MAYGSIRARGYIAGAADVVRRRIHWVVMIVGIFYQVISFDLIAAPVIGIASDQGADIIFALGLLAFGLFLAQIQRGLIHGAQFIAYLATLPISAGRRWFVDLTVLLLANGVLWVPVALGAVFYPGGTNPPTSAELIAGYLNILFAVLAVLLAQLYWLRWNGIALGLVLFALSGVTLLDRLLMGTAYLIALSLAAAICLGLMIWPVASDYRKPRKLSLPKRVRRDMPATVFSAHLPGWLAIQLRALAEKPLGTLLSLLFGLLAMGFGLAVVFLGHKFDMAANIAIVSACFASLFMSKLFYTLHTCHTLSGIYLRALPMPSHYWLLRDWILLGVLTSSVLAPMQLLLLIFTETSFGPLLLSFVVVWALLLVFRVVVERLRQQAVLFSSLATGLFLYLFGVVFL